MTRALPGRAWRRSRVAWLVVAMCALSSVAPGAAVAAAGWQLTANPTTVLAGQPTTIELRLTDTDGSGDIACGRVFIGAQFDVLNAGVRGTSAPSPWTAIVAGAAPSTVSVWNADGNGKLKGGDWVDFYVTVRGNTSGSHAWTANALQNNDCTGDSFLEPIYPVITVASPAPPPPAPTPAPPPPPPPAPDPITPPPAAAPVAQPAPAAPPDTQTAPDASTPAEDSAAPTSSAEELEAATGADSEPDAASGLVSVTGGLTDDSAGATGGASSARASETGASDAGAGIGIGLLMAVAAILGGVGILWLIFWRRRRRRTEEDPETAFEVGLPAGEARPQAGAAGESVDPILASMGLGGSDKV